MNILYYFPEENSMMFQWQRIHIFDELQRHGIYIHSFNPLLCCDWDEANEKIIKIVRENNYDLFMTCICNERMLYIDTLNEIKRQGIPALSFRPDNISIPFNDKVLAPHFDLLWLTAKDTQYLYDKWNVKTVFAPYAANPYVFQFTERSLKRQVCFIGTPYGSRARMMNTLTESGIELSVFHSKQKSDSRNKKANTKISLCRISPFQKRLDRFFFKEGRKLLDAELRSIFARKVKLEPNDCLSLLPSVPFEQISHIYSEFCLALASTSTGYTDILHHPLPVINLRNFEIPMAGGIEICRYNSELSDYFEDGKEIVLYHDDDEMKEKANYYLKKAKDAEIIQMKRAARKRSENEHTWFGRFSLIFKTIGI